MSRWLVSGSLLVSTACCGASDDREHSVTPSSGDYGTVVKVGDIDPGSFLRLRNHGSPLSVPLTTVDGHDGTFRFPFPARGDIDLVAGDSQVTLAPFVPSQPLGEPLVGDYDPKRLQDALLADDRTLLAFPGVIVQADHGGRVTSSRFDVGVNARSNASLFARGSERGVFFVRAGSVFVARASGDRAAVVGTNVQTRGRVLAAGADASGPYFWTDVDETHLARFRADGANDGPTIDVPADYRGIDASVGAVHARIVSASVGPDGTLWLAWSASANRPFDDGESLVIAKLPPAASRFSSVELLTRVDDVIEGARIRATASGVDYFVCGHDQPGFLDSMDAHFCRAGTGAGSSATVSLHDDDAIGVSCIGPDGQPAAQDLQVTRGGETVLHLGACEGITIASVATRAAGGSSVVAVANGGVYSLTTPR